MGFSGAWTCNQRGDDWELVFISFLPNYLHAPGIAFDAGITLGFRVHHLESTLYPGREFSKDTWELVMDRLQVTGAAAEAVH